MPNKSNTSLELLPEKKHTLREMARILGYTIKSGPSAGEGSIRQLLIAIADGEIILSRPEKP